MRFSCYGQTARQTNKQTDKQTDRHVLLLCTSKTHKTLPVIKLDPILQMSDFLNICILIFIYASNTASSSIKLN